MPDFFKLDSNIDLSYIDSNGEHQIIKDAIQVVSGTDGSSVITNEDGTISDYTIVSDLTTSTSISGRGILFSETGDIVAKKGNLVFRDAEGNILTPNLVRYKNVKEDSLNNTFLRDKSLEDVTSGTKEYLSVNQILEAAKQSVLAPGTGNILQASQKKEINTDSVELLTIPLTPSNQVTVKGKVIVPSDATLTLVDETISGSYIELAKSEVKVKSETPVYINFTGNLEHTTEDIEYSVSKTAIYNSFYKRFFQSSRQEGESYTQDSPHKLVLRSSTPFTIGYLNILVSDEKRGNDVIGSQVVLNDSNIYNIVFDEPLEDENYIISDLTASDIVGVWYSDKKNTGFTINLDRNFTGTINWEVTSE